MAKTGVNKFGPVVTELRDRIAHGHLGPGDWLPSETALMDTYVVSRYSAREAIKRLAGEGLIIIVDGKGSYVRARTGRARHTDHRGLTTSPHRPGPGRDSEYRLWAPVEPPSTYRTNAGTDLALALGVPEHTPVFGVDRLLRQPISGTDGGSDGAGERRMLHRLTVPLAACTRIPALADDPFLDPDTLYAVLAEADIHPVITEHVRAAAPTPDDLTSLALSAGASVLTTRRVLRDPHDRVIAMEETRRTAEDTQLSYTINPTPPPSAAATTRA